MRLLFGPPLGPLWAPPDRSEYMGMRGALSVCTAGLGSTQRTQLGTGFGVLHVAGVCQLGPLRFMVCTSPSFVAAVDPALCPSVHRALEYDTSIEKEVKAEMAANSERHKAAMRKQRKEFGNFLKR